MSNGEIIIRISERIIVNDNYENVPMQYTENKLENLIGEFLIFLKFMLKTLIVGTRRGGSNECPQSVF